MGDLSKHGLYRTFDQPSGFLVVDVDLILIDNGPDLLIQIVADLADVLGQELVGAGLQGGDGWRKW